MESVDHNRKLLRSLSIERSLHRPGLRPVRDAEGMQRYGTLFDPLARTELVVAVVQNLVRIHVGVVVRNRDGLRMVVEHAWTEATHDKIMALESLMDRWRHMELPCDRLEIHDVEGKW